jgi:hypothetical protein
MKLTEEQRVIIANELYDLVHGSNIEGETYWKRQDAATFIEDVIEPLLTPVWHPASEPPDTSRDILIVLRGKVRIGYYHDHNYQNESTYFHKPTHWCDLPEPPIPNDKTNENEG